MKKILLAALVVVGFLIAGTGAALATPFSNTVDFTTYNTDGTVAENYIGIEEAYLYTHTLPAEFITPPYILTDATLSLRHNGNSDNTSEIWATSTTSSLFIGQLSNSTQSNDWKTDTWSLSSAVLDLIDNGSPWFLTINLYESLYDSGKDKIDIDWSILAGNYTTSSTSVVTDSLTAVPEPASMLLLGTGLVGVAGVARKRKNNLA